MFGMCISLRKFKVYEVVRLFRSLARFSSDLFAFAFRFCVIPFTPFKEQRESK